MSLITLQTVCLETSSFLTVSRVCTHYWNNEYLMFSFGATLPLEDCSVDHVGWWLWVSFRSLVNRDIRMGVLVKVIPVGILYIMEVSMWICLVKRRLCIIGIHQSFHVLQAISILVGTCCFPGKKSNVVWIHRPIFYVDVEKGFLLWTQEQKKKKNSLGFMFRSNEILWKSLISLYLCTEPPVNFSFLISRSSPRSYRVCWLWRKQSVAVLW